MHKNGRGLIDQSAAKLQKAESEGVSGVGSDGESENVNESLNESKEEGKGGSEGKGETIES